MVLPLIGFTLFFLLPLIGLLLFWRKVKRGKAEKPKDDSWMDGFGAIDFD